jgi:type VI secretion system lysozyme-like protein
VRAHLVRLLHRRRSDVSELLGYGMLGFEAEYAATIESLQRKLERSIQELEPRLHDTRVRAQPRDPCDPLRLRLEIHARLVTRDETLPVRFTSQIDARGRWKVAS